MRNALIGHTGLVGGNLLQQTHFDDTYNSSNIEEIAGKRYGRIVCSGVPAVKWKANREPKQDLDNIERLVRCLEKTRTAHMILISTVDVYATPLHVDEDTTIDDQSGTPYGRHRLMLERFIRDRFESMVVRLPGLFGPGLKKNVVYDFLNNNRLDLICADSIFQFYPLIKLWKDIQVALRAGLRLIHLATEPISVREIAREAFGIEFENPKATTAVTYDMRTKYAHLFNKAGDYIYSSREVLELLEGYVASTGWRRP